MEHVEVHIFDSQLQVISNLPVFDSSASHAFWLCLYQMNDKCFLAIFYLEDKIEQIICEIHINLEFCLFLPALLMLQFQWA